MLWQHPSRRAHATEKRGQESYDTKELDQGCPGCLALALFVLGTTLADLKARIALANHINSAAAADYLTVGVPELQRADR